MKSKLLSLFFVASMVGMSARAALPRSLNFTHIRAVAVQHDGRCQPLDTLARDIVESVTGQERFDGRDPVLWLLSWTFDPSAGSVQPLIHIGNAELRRELRLPSDKATFSFSELITHKPLLQLFDELRRIEPERKMNPLESKASDIHARLLTLQSVFGGNAIRMNPNTIDAQGTWLTPNADPQSSNPRTRSLHEAWIRLRQAFLADDANGFAVASNDVASISESFPSAIQPDLASIALELRYNTLNPFGVAWKIMTLGTVFSLLSILWKRRWLDVLAPMGLIAGFGLTTYGLWLRWHVAGHIPASNMYESLLFLGWGVGACAIISSIGFRARLVPLTASGMSAVALFLADVLPVDHFVRPIPPVLADTVWMSIHVPVIMVSYSVLALAVLIAHVQLIVMTAAPHRREATALLDSLHYWYVHVGSILLTVGIITGSMWAASSWGRYWGWDPKEVWSLVALLGYLSILHVRIDHDHVPRWGYALALALLLAVAAIIIPRLVPLTTGKIIGLGGALVGISILVLTRGMFATAIKSIMCFWLIIMTYVGVNFVLGTGLHSYGFGTGAVVRYMFLIGTTDLIFVAICTAVYLWRRGFTQSITVGQYQSIRPINSMRPRFSS